MHREARHKWFWRKSAAFLTSTVTLATWRWRTQWLMLLVTGLGITIAIVLVTSLPLFSTIMTSAGLRSTLLAQSNGAQILANAKIAGLSSQEVAEASDAVTSLAQQDIGYALQGKPQIAINTAGWNGNIGANNFQMELYGVPMQTAQAHLQLLQGHLPAEHNVNGSTIDILLSRSAALYMGNVEVGQNIPLAATLTTAPLDASSQDGQGPQSYVTTITAHVVGIFQVQPQDGYWNGYTFEAEPPSIGLQPPYIAVTAQGSLLTLLDTIARDHQADGVFFSSTQTQNAVLLSYAINPNIFLNNELDALVAHLGDFQYDVVQAFNSYQFATRMPYLEHVELSGPTLHGEGESILEKFRSQETILQTPTVILTAQIVCLILFFLSMMAGVLVERERPAIAVLRSRGASRRQIFASLLAQGGVLCLIAGLVSPVLAIGLVALVAPHFLSANTQNVLKDLLPNPWLAMRSLGGYTLTAAAITFLTLLFTLSLAMRATIVTQRYETSRAPRFALWQRLRLDFIIAVLALVGYVLIFYLESVQRLLSLQEQVLVSAPLELLAPLLLVLAGILVFFRFFPLALRLLARLARQRRSLSIMLALTQMERSPRQPMRMALLLGLACAFLFFSLVFSASQSQRARDLAAYQAVSDFSGYNLSLPVTSPEDAALVLSQTSARYQRLRGVSAVTTGSLLGLYLQVPNGNQGTYARETDLLAVDTRTFAQTALWSSQYSSQSLDDLMALLANQRQQASQRGVVPAIVANSTWHLLGLTSGAIFHLTNTDGTPDPTAYQAVAEVNHIPSVDDTIHGALLVEYQSLVAGRAYYHESTKPNYIWLRSGAHFSDVNAVRAELGAPGIALMSLLDRRALSDDTTVTLLANNLLSIVSVGVAATLLLAFLANLLLPLLSVRARQTNFAVLRALGTAPGQVARLLVWEQVVVLVTALLLGLFFGALLAFTSVPALVFAGVPPANLINTSSAAIYSLQQALPVTVVIPASLGVALAILLVLCLLSIGLTTSLAQRPLLAQTLRLNED